MDDSLFFIFQMELSSNVTKTDFLRTLSVDAGNAEIISYLCA